MADRREKLYAFGIISFILFLVYLPAIQGYYVYLDDYALWLWDRNWGFRGNQFYYFVGETAGRPIAAFGGIGIGYFIKTLKIASWFRFMNVICASLIGYLFYIWLRRNSVKVVNAALLSVLVITFPPFQVIIGQSQAGVFLMGILVSLAAAFAAFKSAFIKPWWKSIANKYTFFSIALVVTSLAIYQPSAMFYWCIVGMLLLNTNIQLWRNLKRPIFTMFFIHFFAMGIYLFYYKILVPRPMYLGAPAYAMNINLSPEYFGQIKYFITSIMFKTLNLWNIYSDAYAYDAYSWKFYHFMIGVIVFGALIEIFKGIKNCKKNGGNYPAVLFYFFTRDLLIIATLLLTIFVTLISSRLVLYRTLTAIYPLTALLIYEAIKQISSLFPKKIREKIVLSILAVGFLAGIYNAHDKITNHYALTNTIEIRYVKKMLRQGDPQKCVRVHMLPPKTFIYAMPTSPHDEFGLNRGNLVSIARCAANELKETESDPARKQWYENVARGRLPIYSEIPLPEKIEQARFQRKILDKISNEDDKKFISSQEIYSQDKNGDYVINKQVLADGNKMARVEKILNSVGYHISSEDFDDNVLLIDMSAIDFFY